MDVLSEESLNLEDTGSKESLQDSNQQQLRRRLSAIEVDVPNIEERLQRNFYLQYIPQKSLLSDRPLIPATKQERLSFFRSYSSSFCKTEIVCRYPENFNRFLWNHMLNVFARGLPASYLYIFLGLYAPDYHFYLPKMIPMSLGCLFLYLIIGLFDLVSFSDTCLLLLDYLLKGIISGVPWNRCSISNATGWLENKNTTAHCYILEEFKKKISGNVTTTFVNMFYFTSESRKMFQISQIYYFMERFSYFNKTSDLEEYNIVYGYFLFLWVLAAVNYKQLFNRHIWKLIHSLQIVSCVILGLMFVHLEWENIENKSKNIPEVQTYTSDQIRMLWKADLEFMAECLIAPPVLHILTARSSQEVNLGNDSTALVTSNTIFYLMKSLVLIKLKKFVNNHVGISVQSSQFNQYSFFYIMPIYFSTFYLGDLYFMVFLLVICCAEVLTFVVTFQCLVEVIVCEWRQISRIICSFVIISAAFFLTVLTENEVRFFMVIFSKSVTAIVEITLLYLLYPLDRLFDDNITFHYGVAPSTLRTMSLRVSIGYYTVKFYLMITTVLKLLKISSNEEIFNQISYSFTIMTIIITVILLLGVLYVIFKFKYKDKKKWSHLFRPHSDFGPRDPVEKELRKLYDSREYIGFEAARNLSRYLTKKSKAKVYQLDEKYDDASNLETSMNL